MAAIRHGRERLPPDVAEMVRPRADNPRRVSYPDDGLPWKVGDVCEDSYANPAVVVKVYPATYSNPLMRGLPETVIQTTGSDRGNLTSVYLPALKRITDPSRVKWARDIARPQWVRLHAAGLI